MKLVLFSSQLSWQNSNVPSSDTNGLHRHEVSASHDDTVHSG